MVALSPAQAIELQEELRDKITLEQSIEYVAETLKNHKMPEPTRHAHRFANECRRAWYEQKERGTL